MLAAWEHGQKLTMVKNPHYWEPGLPHIGQLGVPVVPSY